MARLSDDQKLFLGFLPDDGSAIGGHALFAELQDAGWRTRDVENVMGELRELGEILVGRGGGGGSIRHVRNDRRALLDALDEFAEEESPTTRPALQQHMDWHPDYLEQVLDALLEREKIQIGPGRGGVITRILAEEEEDAVEPQEPGTTPGDLDADERTLLDLIPESGTIGNTRLRRELSRGAGWDDDRYWETRKLLRQRNLIEVGRGRGGSVRRVSIGAVVSTPEPAVRPEHLPPKDVADDAAVMQQIPENGESVDLHTLQQRLTWSNDRFYEALEHLAIGRLIHWNRTRVMRLLPDSTTGGDARAQDRTPPPTPPTTPQAALYGFFCDRFNTRSLELFFTYNLQAPAVVQSVAWSQNIREVAHQVVMVLVSQNYVDSQLFDQLRVYLPRLHPQIDALAGLWPKT